MKQITWLLALLFFTFTSFSQVSIFSDSIEIDHLTNELSEDSLYQNTIDLENFGTRFMLAPNRKLVAEYLYNRLITYPSFQLRIDSFLTQTVWMGLDTTTWQYNVIATLPGSQSNSGKILLCAHYDCILTNGPGNPFQYSPGADDDGSGVAALLEIARVLQNSSSSLKCDLEIAFFAAEELMNFGQGGYDYHAQNAVQSNIDYKMIIHADMIAFNDGNDLICLSHYPGCESKSNLLAEACNNYTALDYLFWPSNMGPFADRAFYNVGYECCVYVEESYFNPYYHTGNDVTGVLDFEYCKEVSKMILAGVFLQNEEMLSMENRIVNEVSVYPNPTQHLIFIAGISSGITPYQIYSMDGSLIQSGTLDSTNPSIRLNIPQGVYQLIIDKPILQKTFSIVKQ